MSVFLQTNLIHDISLTDLYVNVLVDYRYWVYGTQLKLILVLLIVQLADPIIFDLLDPMAPLQLFFVVPMLVIQL